jgi:hypothetical protein
VFDLTNQAVQPYAAHLNLAHCQAKVRERVNVEAVEKTLPQSITYKSQKPSVCGSGAFLLCQDQ